MKSVVTRRITLSCFALEYPTGWCQVKKVNPKANGVCGQWRLFCSTVAPEGGKADELDSVKSVFTWPILNCRFVT